MPNGYTSDIYDGKNPTFRDFALGCARAFGAYVTMRDDPKDAPLPTDFQPDQHDRVRMDEALQRTSELIAMSDEECEAASGRAFLDASERWIESVAKNDRMRADYNAMIEEAKRFVSPSPEHDEYAKFLVKTLEESRDFDVHDMTTPNPYWHQPVRKTGEEWRASEMASAATTLKYASESWAKELERTAQRNKWVKALFAALPEPSNA